MNILIEAPFELNATDEKIIRDTLNGLTKYEARITEITLFFKLDDGTTENAILAEIRIRVPGKDLFVAESDEDAMVAFKGAYNTVKRQVKKRRDILNDHHSPIRDLNEIVNNTY